MSLPKVSVIIPNYNHAEYLRQRLNSVLNQTFKNFEVIILDDCSTDQSKDILKEYVGHPLVKEIVFNDQNTGNPFKQWQFGLEKSEGEWVWIAESDDYADELFLETMISVCENQPNVALAYCDSKIVTNGIVLTETFATIKNKTFATNRWSEDYVNKGTNEIEDYLLLGGTINNSSAVLFKRELLIKMNPFDISLRYIGDKYAFVKVLSAGNVIYSKQSMNYYRDPFNSKHIDKLPVIFYEQFLIFNWVHRNLKSIRKSKFLNAFYINTSLSLFRGWTRTKISIYIKLFNINRVLFIRNIAYNLIRPFKDHLVKRFLWR